VQVAPGNPRVNHQTKEIVMSSIGSVGSYASSLTSATSGARHQRPDPTKLAEQLFAQLDTKGQGYIEKSDLQSAFDQSSTSASNSSASVDQVFGQLDGNGDGKVTQGEMSTSLNKLAAELDSQFNQMRMKGASGGPGGAGGPPPGPPPGGDAGFTKDELTSKLSEIGSSDSKRSDLMTKVVNNFEAADTNGDGKVTFQEATAYDQKSNTSSTTSSGTSATVSSGEPTSSNSSSSNDLAIMKRIVDLMHAYGNSTTSGESGTSSLLRTLNVSA
jgi:Ca2+-binding EF-hand superfamily protein